MLVQLLPLRGQRVKRLLLRDQALMSYLGGTKVGQWQQAARRNCMHAPRGSKDGGAQARRIDCCGYHGYPCLLRSAPSLSGDHALRCLPAGSRKAASGGHPAQTNRQRVAAEAVVAQARGCGGVVAAAAGTRRIRSCEAGGARRRRRAAESAPTVGFGGIGGR
jgi:hypothetical protein